MIFLFSHRHSKDDKFLVETKEAMEKDSSKGLHFDFDIVRNVMYLYSKKAQEHFFTFPVESFFLAYFAASKDGLNFLKSKPDCSQKRQRLLHDTEELKQIALGALEGKKGDKMCLFLSGLVRKLM